MTDIEEMILAHERGEYDHGLLTVLIANWRQLKDEIENQDYIVARAIETTRARCEEIAWEEVSGDSSDPAWDIAMRIAALKVKP